MSDSLAGQKSRVMALSAQASQAIEDERYYRQQIGVRTQNALSHGKVIALASVAGLAIVAVLRHRRKRKKDEGEEGAASDKSGLLAKAGMAVLVVQRLGGLVAPFMHGMHWVAQRDSRPTDRIPEPARTGE